MVSLRSLIINSTFPALFSSALVFVAGGLQIQLFYFLMMLNLFLMMYLRKIWIPRGLVILASFIFASGVLGIAMGSDTVALFCKQLAGISISALYFCCFVRLMDFDAGECFRKYAQIAYYVAIIGFFLFPLQYAYLDKYRFQSVLTEPAMFATTCLPAMYYFADQWQKHRREGRKLLVMSVAFVLAGSSVGFLGVMFGLCIFGQRYRRSVALIPVLIGLLGVGIYSVSSDFRLRLNDTTKSISTLDVGDANLSTFALLSNVFVTAQSVKDHPLFGTGVGSHPLSYAKFIGGVPGVESWEDTPYLEINATDANSMLLRVLSEFGFIGTLFLIWFIWHYRARDGLGLGYVSQAIWIYFFVKLLRGGVYFSPEQFFFIVVYAINRRNVMNSKASLTYGREVAA